MMAEALTGSAVRVPLPPLASSPSSLKTCDEANSRLWV